MMILEQKTARGGRTPLRATLAAMLLLGLASPASAQLGTLTADSYAPGKSSAGTAGELVITGTPTGAAYVRFDLSSLPASAGPGDLEKATMTIYVNYFKAAGSICVAPITANWSESDALSTVLPTGPSLGCVSVGSGSVYNFIAIDVTSAVRDWLANPASNFGLAVSGAGTVSIKIDSKESKKAGQPAQLDVAFAGYGPTGATGPDGLQGLPGPSGATGLAGPAGATGSAGAAGATGLAGPAGATGSAGAAGATGLAGPAGATGSAGAAGATGLAGPAG
ncbi:MAG: hypothetical protein RL698_2054, partial [Pseudomonadota bacterium]